MRDACDAGKCLETFEPFEISGFVKSDPKKYLGDAAGQVDKSAPPVTLSRQGISK